MYFIESMGVDDLQRVDDLARLHKKTIGFLPLEALRDYLQSGHGIRAVTEDGELVGFLLYGEYTDRFRLAQLCIAQAHQGNGLARKLVEELISRATTQKAIKLRCRRDFLAHTLWGKLGFRPLAEQEGRSASGKLLTLWSYPLDEDDELGLWSVENSENSLDVVIDAQIFYDFNEDASDKSLASKGLRNDHLVDCLLYTSPSPRD